MHGKVPLWTTTIIENVLKELAVANGEAAKVGKQKFKYIGTWAARLSSPLPRWRPPARSCPRSLSRRIVVRPPPRRPELCRDRCATALAVNAQMQQKTGAAMITACAAYWDKATDGTAITKWENEGIQVLVTVHGIAI